MATKKTPTAAELSRQALADAKALRDTRAAALQAARDAAEELRDRLNGGDDTVTAVDLTTADAEVERATSLAAAADRAVTRAERAIVNDDLTVANLLAPLVSEALSGLVPVTTVATLSEARDSLSDAQTGAVYIVQETPGTSYRGIHTGHVRVLFTRSPLFAPLDVQTIISLARAKGFEVSDQGTNYGVGGTPVQDLARLHVAKIHPDTLSLDQYPSEEDFRQFGLDVNGAIYDSVKDIGRGATMRYTGERGVHTSATLVSSREVGTGVVKNGATHHTVAVQFRVVLTMLQSGDPAQRMRAAIADMVGKAIPGVGTVVSFGELHMEHPTMGSQPIDISVQFVVAHELTAAE